MFGHLDILWFLFSFTLFFFDFCILPSLNLNLGRLHGISEGHIQNPILENSLKSDLEWLLCHCKDKGVPGDVCFESLPPVPYASLREVLVFVYAFSLICGTDCALILCLCAEVSLFEVNFVLVLLLNEITSLAFVMSPFFVVVVIMAATARKWLELCCLFLCDLKEQRQMSKLQKWSFK